MFLHIHEIIVFLRAEFPINLTKVLYLLVFTNKLLILMLIDILEEVESYHWSQLHHGCKPFAKHTSVLGLPSFSR